MSDCYALPGRPSSLGVSVALPCRLLIQTVAPRAIASSLPHRPVLRNSMLGPSWYDNRARRPLHVGSQGVLLLGLLQAYS